jgi:hypothetical protein
MEKAIEKVSLASGKMTSSICPALRYEVLRRVNDWTEDVRVRACNLGDSTKDNRDSVPSRLLRTCFRVIGSSANPGA